MQFIRTAIWALLTAVVVAFVAINWTPVRVNIWPDSRDYQGFIHVQGPLGLLILLAFALGALPTWLFGAMGRWRMKRRMAHLENAVRAQVVAEPLPEPVIAEHRPPQT